MAEALMRRLWEQYGDGSRLEVSSAGLTPIENRASEHVRELLALEGISFDSHVPRRLTQSLIGEARLILTMEEHHRRAVVDRYPETVGRVFLLKEYAGITDGVPGIKDPYGSAREIYSRTLEEIREAVKKTINRLMGTGKLFSGEEASEQ